MSSEVHCSVTGTVVTTWSPQTPSSGKPFNELKLKLDDKLWNEKRFSGKSVAIKSYDRQDFLTQVAIGDRIFVTGTVKAEAYVSKKTGKPAAYLVVYAKTVTVDGDPPHSEERPPVAAPPPARSTTSAKADPLNGPIDDDDVPF